MTDLTEQWQKGELPDGWYYVQLKEGVYVDNVKSIIMDYYTEFSDFMKHPYLTEEVLAPVPSYEEWQAKLEENTKLKEYERIVTSYNMKPIDYEIACETVNKLLDERKAFKEENTKLKTDCRTLAQKLLQVKPELREWLETNYGEYL